MAKNGIFVTGTDTGVGKTVVSSLIVSALQQAKLPVGYFKPVQTGTDDDCNEVQRLCGLSDEKIARPVYSYPEPIAPYRASLLHQDRISLETIRRSWDQLDDRTWVVEGAGGILVPLSRDETVRDLIAALQLPTIVVASTRLGTINHTLLTLEAAERAGIQVLGVVLVGDADLGLNQVIREAASVPILAEIPRFDL